MRDSHFSFLDLLAVWLRQPHVAEVLVDVVARADLPSAHDGAVRDDPVKPQGEELMHLFV